MTRENARGRPSGRPRHAELRSSSPAVAPAEERTTTCMVADGVGMSTDPSPCPACGHDEVAALRRLIAERRTAWIAGKVEAFGEGWIQGMEAAAERGRAA